MLISAQKKCLLDTSVVIENVRKSSYSPLHKFTLTGECEFPIQEGAGGGLGPQIFLPVST